MTNFKDQQTGNVDIEYTRIGYSCLILSDYVRPYTLVTDKTVSNVSGTLVCLRFVVLSKFTLVDQLL